MAEPVNSKKRKVLVNVEKKKLDMHQRKQGELPPASEDKKSKSQEYCGTDNEAGTEEMDLSKVDNENKENFNEFALARKKEDWHNWDIDAGHGDRRPTVVSKKEAGAGK